MMKRAWLRKAHPVAGGVAMVLMGTFWVSTLSTELLGTAAMVTAVKTAIVWGLLLLVPALMVAGGSGHRLAGQHRDGVVGVKARRMPWIAANGLLVLIPSALFLMVKARAGAFDGAFYTVQALELVAGAINLTLLGLNMRDGLRMKLGGGQVRVPEQAETGVR
ncbi:MAG: hypothetical protein AAFS10_09190 [Myxococcota bacterium]